MSSTRAVDSPKSRRISPSDRPRMLVTPNPPSLAPTTRSQATKKSRRENPPQDQSRAKSRVRAAKNTNTSPWASCLSRQRSTRLLRSPREKTAKAHSVMATIKTMGMGRRRKCTTAFTARAAHSGQLPRPLPSSRVNSQMRARAV